MVSSAWSHGAAAVAAKDVVEGAIFTANWEQDVTFVMGMINNLFPGVAMERQNFERVTHDRHYL